MTALSTPAVAVLVVACVGFVAVAVVTVVVAVAAKAGVPSYLRWRAEHRYEEEG